MKRERLTTISKDQYWQLAGLLALGKQSEQRSKDVRDAIADLLGVADIDRDHDWISEAVFEGFSPDKLLEKLGIPLLFNDGLSAERAGEPMRTGSDIVGDAQRQISDRYATGQPVGYSDRFVEEAAAREADAPNAGGADSP